MACTQLDPISVALRSEDASLEHEAMDAIRRALRGLRYGQIVVIVQNGVVVQVDRTERKRLRLNGRG
jgi:hypothetical protein